MVIVYLFNVKEETNNIIDDFNKCLLTKSEEDYISCITINNRKNELIIQLFIKGVSVTD